MSLLSNHPRYTLITALSFLALIVLSLAIYKYDNYTHTTGKVIALESQPSKNTPYLVTLEYEDRQQQKHQIQVKMSAKPLVITKFDLRYPKDQPKKASLYDASYLWTLRILRYMATFLFLSGLMLLCRQYEP